MSDLNGLVLDLDETTYHAHPALSSTQARQLLESPARYNYARTHKQARKDSFDLGTAVHSKVLGVGTQAVEYPAEHLTPSGMVSSSKATVAWLANERAQGHIVLTASELRKVNGMTEAVLGHPIARALFEKPGNAEASVFATDPETGVEVRSRFDFLPELTYSNPIAVDLKTTAKTADREGFNKSVVNFGYETQQEWYEDTLRFAFDTEIPFVFVVVETDAPHLVGVHQLDVVYRQMGATKARRARELHAACTASGEWPGYPAEVQLLSPPTYSLIQHEEKYS
jgi:hypothetical protein